MKIFSSREGKDIAIGIILGVIVTIAATELTEFIHRQPDFYITGPTFIPETGGNGSFEVVIHNLYGIFPKDRYAYSITLIGYEINTAGIPKYFSQPDDGIIVEPIFSNRTIFINDLKRRTATVKYIIGKNVAKGDHLMEIKAIGRDGTERRYNFDLKL